jgi:hypothetical protein
VQAAALVGDAQKVVRLIEAHVSNEPLAHILVDGAMQGALSRDHEGVVKALVRQGWAEWLGRAKLARQAATHRSHRSVRVLLKAWPPGAGAEAGGGGGVWGPAMHEAARRGDEEMLRLLVDAGVDPAARVDGKTPARLARQMGHEDLAAYLDAVKVRGGGRGGGGHRCGGGEGGKGRGSSRGMLLC